MIAADDPRHGTNAGYMARCREACCKKAHADYRRNLNARQYIARGPMTIPAIGSQRRIRALQALGWRISDIASELDLWVADNGVCQTLWQLMHRDSTTRATAAKIDAVYRRLSMTPGPCAHSRARAVNRGYAPPLAWDNIDDPDERPRGTVTGRRTASVDHAVVARMIAGEQMEHTVAERREVVEYFWRLGMGEREIAKRCGLAEHNVDMDIRRLGLRRAS